MKRDTIQPIQSSFLSCEKDLELILHKLFIEHPKYAEILKRLLVINNPDCLTNLTSEVYKKKIEEMTLSKLIQEGYIIFDNLIRMPEHEEKKTYLLISFDDFTLNKTNPKYRDCILYIDIISQPEDWMLENYQLRPMKIAGYIDGLLNETKLTGIGKLYFGGFKEMPLNYELHGFTLKYYAIHMTDGDDSIPPEEE